MEATKQRDKNLYSTTSTNLTNLTESNYYDRQTDWQYLSKSIYWQFLQCEAAGLAMMKENYNPFTDDSALIFGNYVHSYLEGEEAHKKFLSAYASKIYKRGSAKNGLLKKYELAETMIQSLEDDPVFFPKLYQGQKEAIVTGKIDGVMWKGKIDCLDLKRKLFIDFKTVDNIHKKHWKNGQYLNFALDRGYDTQMAIYQELIKQTFGVTCIPLITAMSKQEIPDKQTIEIPQPVLNAALDEVKEKQPRVEQVLNGEEKPIGCGQCDYCRSQKTFDDIVDISEIELY